MRTFVDEPAVKKVAESMRLPEDIVRTMVKLRNQGLGFRRISRRVRETHSYELGKDKAREVLLKYDELARPTEPPPDKDFERLALKLEEEKRKKHLREEAKRREEEKCRMRKEHLLLKLENEGDGLIRRVVKRKVWKEDPKLYGRFREFCEQRKYTFEQALRYLCDAESLSHYIREFYMGEWSEMEGLTSWIETCLEDTLELGISLKTMVFIEEYGPFKCPRCWERDVVLKRRSDEGDVVGCFSAFCDIDFKVKCPSCRMFMRAVEGEKVVYKLVRDPVGKLEVIAFECPKCGLKWKKHESQEWPPNFVYKASIEG
jgi:hypothetical protein